MARASGPPPGRSIYDATPASQSTDHLRVETPVVSEAQDVDAVSRAAKELSSTARSDLQRVDLNDLLSQTSREASYSEVPAGVRGIEQCETIESTCSLRNICHPSQQRYLQATVQCCCGCSGLPF